jgi:hypothetical protein
MDRGAVKQHAQGGHASGGNPRVERQIGNAHPAAPLPRPAKYSIRYKICCI